MISKFAENFKVKNIYLYEHTIDIYINKFI